MSRPDKLDFFTGLAAVWDAHQDAAALAGGLAAGLEELGVAADEAVLDVGCGTGNLSAALLARLGPHGRVVAFDFAPAMIEVARAKNRDDTRVRWLEADAERLPLAAASFDRIICFSVWPHLDDPAAAASELARVLRGGGRLHVWHLASKARINAIHAAASHAVQHDLLAPGSEVAAVLEAAGLTPVQVVDDDDRYLVSAVKRAG